MGNYTDHKETVSIFGTDYKGRKQLPLYFFLTRYFPKALVEVLKVCVAGNMQHNKDLDPADIHWARGKSMDQLNTAIRHIMDHGTMDSPFDDEPPEVLAAMGLEKDEGIYHLAKAAWRVLAELELVIEKRQQSKLGPATGIRDPEQAVPGTKIVQRCGCGEREFAYDSGDLPPQVIKGRTMHRAGAPCYQISKGDGGA